MIKKILLIYFGLLLLSINAKAVQIISFGLRGNFNGAKFVWNENTNASINEKIGFGGGGYVNYRLNRLISFRSELLFNQKGAEVVQSYIQGDTLTGITFDHYNTSDTRLNYIELPFLMDFNLPASLQPRLILCFGFYTAFLISASQTITASASSGVIELDSAYYTPESAFRKNDYGLVLGGRIPMGKIELGGSYSIGFPRILRPDAEDINQYVDHRNRVLSLTVGYRIK